MSEAPARVFPILLGHGERETIKEARAAGATTLIIGLPWDMIEPHEDQARRNHGGQSLERLAERGGLSAAEAVAVLAGRMFRPMSKVEAQFRLALALAKHAAALAPEHEKPRAG